MLEYAGKSKYYRQAVMRTLGRREFLSNHELERLCNFPVSTEHPFTSILYWSTVALKNAGLNHEKMLPDFQKALVHHAVMKAKALKYIACSYYSKAVQQGLIQADIEFENFHTEITQKMNGLEDPLGLLRCNYL